MYNEKYFASTLRMNMKHIQFARSICKCRYYENIITVTLYESNLNETSKSTSYTVVIQSVPEISNVSDTIGTSQILNFEDRCYSDLCHC